MSTRVLIVDDHRLAREAIRTALRLCHTGDVEVVGEAEDGTQAVEMARRLRPDVVTMDVGLPDANGLEVTRRLKADMPELNAVVVTGDYGYEKEAFDAGAILYVTKDRLVQELPGWMENLIANRS